MPDFAQANKENSMDEAMFKFEGRSSLKHQTNSPSKVVEFGVGLTRTMGSLAASQFT